MASCTRAGCTGTIEGGYCNECGFAEREVPAPAAPAPSPRVPVATPAPTASTAPACERGGCSGQIEDGYCNVCGMVPPVRQPAPAAVASGPLLTGDIERLGGRCEQDGCGGHIEDGYCNVCGMAPSGASLRTAGIGSDSASGGPSASGTSPSRETVRWSVGSNASDASRTDSGGSRSSRGNLGAGLVEMPSVPYRDPLSVVLEDPKVPERKRYCADCGDPVGRSHEGRPESSEGWCPHCGAPYSFTPKLWPGDLVGGQYLVAGCIAHGGLGWVYLAQDKNVSDRWVVLKGLLDSKDESAMSAAIAERRFLAEVEHPNIVKIYNFVQHKDAGYIVMEYVGGESLREVRNRHREEFGAPLPLARAIAYILEILPAFGFLHRRGLLFCDFKPDNIIQTEEQVKLIDLGGVRALDDQDSDLYGTVGYQAPEVGDSGASISSDLYTVARTLAILSFDFPGFQDEKRYAHTLPPAREVPVLARYEPFHQFLLKATGADPLARFRSAGEMAEQLVGVLRQVIALDGGNPPPSPSTLFSAELGHATTEPAWADLPTPVVDPFDPAAALLTTAALAGPEQMLAALESAPRSPELAYQLARSWIDAGDFDKAEAELDSPEAHAGGWRVAWWRGVLHLANDRPEGACAFFGAVAAELPGELAPRLALAVALELSAAGPGYDGHGGITEPTLTLRQSEHYYGIVSATDPSYASAAFGLSRVRLALGDRAGAVEALRRISTFSSSHLAAQIGLCQLQCADVDGSAPTLVDLTGASAVLGKLAVEPSVRLPLVRDLHRQALRLLEDGDVAADAGIVLAGNPFDEVAQRNGMEQTLRSLAKLAPTDKERCQLVDQANHFRSRTFT